jgi:bleomycin hydrolase
MIKKFLLLLICFILIFSTSYSQKTNTSFYKEVNEKKRLTTDFSKIEKPKSKNDFKTNFHLDPVRQDTTGTCWCFSTTSLLESELKRLGKEPVRLSVMFTVYYEYIEKCRRYIREKGNSEVSEGSQNNAVLIRMKEYGAVPLSAYDGLLGKKSYNHKEMVKEIVSYLEYIKKNNYWDEEKSIEYIKLILNKHMGIPPSNFMMDGDNITPQEYFQKYLRLPLDDYVGFISTKSIPFYTKGEYDVPDNWWHSKDYHNIPLDEFYSAIINAVSNGYTLTIAGDISELGLDSDEGIAIIPTFDCPPDFVDQDSREFRFDNKTTQDDHGVHLVGYKKIGKDDWFLVKDSWRTGWGGGDKGYIFVRGDYIKLKMLAFMVHKDVVKNVLAKFK